MTRNGEGLFLDQWLNSAPSFVPERLLQAKEIAQEIDDITGDIPYLFMVSADFLSELPICGVWNLLTPPIGYKHIRRENGSVTRYKDLFWVRFEIFTLPHAFAYNPETGYVLCVTPGQFFSPHKNRPGSRLEYIIKNAGQLVRPITDGVLALSGHASEIEQVLGLRYSAQNL